MHGEGGWVFVEDAQEVLFFQKFAVGRATANFNNKGPPKHDFLGTQWPKTSVWANLGLIKPTWTNRFDAASIYIPHLVRSGEGIFLPVEIYQKVQTSQTLQLPITLVYEMLFQPHLVIC